MQRKNVDIIITDERDINAKALAFAKFENGNQVYFYDYKNENFNLTNNSEAEINIYMIFHGEKGETDLLFDEDRKPIELNRIIEILTKLLLELNSENYFSMKIKPVLTLGICYAAGFNTYNYYSIASKIHCNLAKNNIYLNVKAWIDMVWMTTYFPTKIFQMNENEKIKISKLHDELVNNAGTVSTKDHRQLYKTLKNKKPYTKYTLIWEKDEQNEIKQRVIVHGDKNKFYFDNCKTVPKQTKEVQSIRAKL